METITLIKPITIKGKETKTISLDFGALTGRSLIAAEKETRATGETNMLIESSKTYQAAVAAQMIGCPVDDVLAMNAKDFQHVTMAVLAFLGA